MLSPGQTKPQAPIGQAINSDSIRQGLLRESAFKPQTGTFSGDRAAQDFAKQNQFAASAQMGRDMARTNAQVFGQQQQQGEQMHQQWKQAQMSRFKGLSNQRAQQSSLAMKLLEDQINMQSDWQTRLIGMME
jgi:hypothetical protein